MNQSLKPFLNLILCLPVLTRWAHSDQTGPARRILGGDDSTHRLAIVAPDGTLEWEVQVGPIHDASVLPMATFSFNKAGTE